MFAGQPGLVANCLLAVALFSVPYTSGAAALFFGMSILLAAWRAQPGCEITVVSNLVLGRDDQVGCCFFGPVDDWEARRSRPSQSGQLTMAADLAAASCAVRHRACRPLSGNGRG